MDAIFSRFVQSTGGEVSDGKAGGDRPQRGGVAEVGERRGGRSGKVAIIAPTKVSPAPVGSRTSAANEGHAGSTDKPSRCEAMMQPCCPF